MEKSLIEWLWCIYACLRASPFVERRVFFYHAMSYLPMHTICMDVSNSKVPEETSRYRNVV